MKKLLLVVSLTTFSFSNAIAVTLYDALNQTYQNNIQLNAERENLKASEEDINISKSDYMPSLTLSGSKSIEDTNKLTNQTGGDATISDVDPFTTSIKLEQTLLDFGRGLELKKSITGLNLAKAKLTKKEQDVLHSAIDAYSSLILAREKQNINRKNLNLLKRQVENDRIRLDRGQITITDLAQSESSLAGARANLIKAQTELLSSKTNFERVTREKIPDTSNLNEKIYLILPNSLEESLQIANSSNVDLLISNLDYEISVKELNIEKARLSPSASINFSKSENKDFSSTIDETDQETVKATITWPIIKGGENISSIKKSSFNKQRYQLILQDTKNRINTDISNAWSKFQSSKSVLEATKVQLKAAEIANEGISLEYDSGSTRTTLELIQSRSLLLDARIAFARSERDFVVSQFELAKQLGSLSIKSLK